MNIEARKLSLIKEFLNLDNEKTILALENLLLKIKSESFEENLNLMSIKQLNDEIDQALDDEKNNRFTTISDLKKKIKTLN